MIQEEMGAFTSCLGLSLMDILEAVKISEDELYDLLRKHDSTYFRSNLLIGLKPKNNFFLSL